MKAICKQLQMVPVSCFMNKLQIHLHLLQSSCMQCFGFVTCVKINMRRNYLMLQVTACILQICQNWPLDHILLHHLYLKHPLKQTLMFFFVFLWGQFMWKGVPNKMATEIMCSLTAASVQILRKSTSSIKYAIFGSQIWSDIQHRRGEIWLLSSYMIKFYKNNCGFWRASKSILRVSEVTTFPQLTWLRVEVTHQGECITTKIAFPFSESQSVCLSTQKATQHHLQKI